MTGAAYAERKPKPTKWELGITFPGEDMLPLIPTLGSVFGAASSAIGHVASDIKTGKTTAGAVKKQWEPVKGTWIPLIKDPATMPILPLG